MPFYIMKIEYLKIKDIKPYKNNPRVNDEAVDAVKNSIQDFGFRNPILIDQNNEIVAGHTRAKAAAKLKLTEVPCIRIEDLTEEQIKAFRIADNSSSELAVWDMKKLELELEDISFDMEDFGLKFDFWDTKESSNGYYGDERERTFDAYNLSEFDYTEAEGFYEMPALKPCDVIPDDLIGFNYMLTATNKDVGVHFYVDDYQFERIWNKPEMYIDRLKEFQCVFTPDFSLYLDMPMAMKIWNVYRSRLIGQIMQRRGIEVIPTVSWAEPATFQFCFDGLPEDATLSVSTIGVKLDPDALEIWKTGMDEMISRLRPKRLLVYGGKLEYDYGKIEVVYYENVVTKRMAGN